MNLRQKINNLFLTKSFLTFILVFFASINLRLNADYLDYIYTNQYPSYNSFGQIGIIQTPSAKNFGEGSTYFTFNQNEIWKYGSLTISPFDWLEASYFYYRPSDLIWASNGFSAVGKYLDKGFNVKFTKSFKDNPNLHIAAGLDDFAGTGLFTKEYIVGTYDLSKSISFNLGLGWGFFNGEKDGSGNIFSSFIPEFKERPSFSANYNLGGSPSYDLWFRGKNSIFWGIEANLPYAKGLKIKIENDPFDYYKFTCCGSGISEKSIELRQKKSNINFGLVFPVNETFSISISKIKGDTLNFIFSFGGNFSKPIQKKQKTNLSLQTTDQSSDKKMNFYLNLLSNLNNNEIYLQTANLSPEKELKLAVTSSKYIYPLEVKRNASLISKIISEELNYEINTIETTLVNAGIETVSISAPTSYLQNKNQSFVYPKELLARNVTISGGEIDDYKFNEFKPIVRYPENNISTSFGIRNHVGDPAKFYYGGVDFNIENEIRLASNIVLEGSISHALTSNFDDKRNFPDSSLPNVRTEIVRYLQESRTFVSRLQLNYFDKFSNNLFFKASAGILESMYGGVGVELMYKPFSSNFSIGTEMYSVKKRSYDQRFSFLEYEIDTGHLNLNYFFTPLGIDLNISYGKYLAGDKGYTFDIGRELQSGFKAGIFFTRTDVSAELFGEGSFDKGFYFRIPYDLMFADRRGGFFNFTLRPLTRDGGQKLEQGSKINGIFDNTSFYEIDRDWVNF